MGAMNRAFSGVDSLGSRNLGRCPRLRLNGAPLALNTLEVLLLHGHKCADWNSGSAARSAIAPYQFGVVRVSVIARSQVCRLEFRRKISARYLPVTECSRATLDSSAHNPRAFQNRDSSGA